MTWEIREGDSLELLRQMPDESVQLREIPGMPGYAASSDGRIWSRRSLGRDDRGRIASIVGESWRELRPSMRKGYPHVAPCIDGRNVLRSVHRLVLLAWVGPAPDGCEACHNNGDRSGARLCNLRWDTRAANHRDKRRHGTDQTGERNGAARLSNEQVRQIRRRRAGGERNVDLAREYGVHPVHISNIVRDATRRHA